MTLLYQVQEQVKLSYGKTDSHSCCLCGERKAEEGHQGALPGKGNATGLANDGTSMCLPNYSFPAHCIQGCTLVHTFAHIGKAPHIITKCILSFNWKFKKILTDGVVAITWDTLLQTSKISSLFRTWKESLLDQSNTLTGTGGINKNNSS